MFAKSAGVAQFALTVDEGVGAKSVEVAQSANMAGKSQNASNAKGT